MSELTNYQTKKATAAFLKACGFRSDLDEDEIVIYRQGFILASPFLQLPWDPPTALEVDEIGKGYFSANGILSAFVQRRNSDVLSKLGDSRRDKIIQVLSLYPDRAPEIADKILAAFDESR